MTMTLKIRMDNEAFTTGHELECARILKQFSDRIVNDLTLSIGDEYPLMDSNGNTCGTVKVTR